MPLNRTPPLSSPAPPLQPVSEEKGIKSIEDVIIEKVKSPLHHYESAPDLHALANITERKKRKYDDDEGPDLLDTIKEMFLTSSVEQDKRFNEIKSSIDLISSKYDDFLSKISSLEKENKADKAKIKELEEKLENLERKTRGVGVEIRNLPKQTGETKESLQTEIIKLGKTLNVVMDVNSIKDIYRTKSQDASNPVVIDFTTVLMKEKVLKAVKNFNKNKQKGNKLNTTHLNPKYQLKPLYVSESLTSKTRKLFYMARQFQASHGFNFCWTSNGIVYLKQHEGSSYVRINDFNDLENLRKTLSP